jgi:hypothetical protein
MTTAPFAALMAGVAAGLAFNPVAAAFAAATAAGLSGYRRAPHWRVWASAGVLVAGFAVGDGLRIVAAGGDTLRIVVASAMALAIGYVLPAVAGAYVGRQVHKGTGYLSAIVVALTLVGALYALVHPIAAAISKLG